MLILLLRFHYVAFVFSHLFQMLSELKASLHPAVMGHSKAANMIRNLCGATFQSQHQH